MRARTQAQWGGVAMACDHFRYPAVNIYDLLYFLFCCSFNFNYALWPWWLGEPFPFQIEGFVLALDLDLALFRPSLRWYWCCYFFSGFGISFAFDYVFGIIQVLSLVPPFSPSVCPLLVAVPRAGLGFILKCLIVGACICVSSLSAVLCRATLPQGHTDRVPPFPFLPLYSTLLVPFTHQVWLWLRPELFCVRHFNESI